MRDWTAASIAAVVVASALAGCSLPGDERTFTTDGVTVVDGSGLVIGVTTGASPPPDEKRPLVVSAGNLTRIAVHWNGSSCVDEWRVAIPLGNALRIVIEPAKLAADPCQAIPEPRAVVLDLNRVVQADAIDIEQAGAAPSDGTHPVARRRWS